MRHADPVEIATVKIVTRVLAFAAVLGIYYGLAALLPADAEAATGLVAVATVAIGEFIWARRDGRMIDLSDGLRDWLVSPVPSRCSGGSRWCCSKGPPTS